MRLPKVPSKFIHGRSDAHCIARTSNSYTDVTCLVEFQGPNFSKLIYGFWGGGNKFIVRIVATASGTWHWQSGSNQENDHAFNNQSG
ncbi:MAG TPA: DUF5060 domain-containing protein [Bacteroidota bacterium]|nr:DUF5060 domain-containing protein [Bacteroidota bacterium]